MMFDNKKIEYLEQERQKLWDRLTSLENKVKELANSDSNTSKIRGLLNKSTHSYKLIQERFDAVEDLSEELNKVRKLVDSFTSAYNNIETANRLANEIKNCNEDVQLRSQEIKSAAQAIQTAKASTETQRNEAASCLQKISNFHNEANNFVREIEDFRDEIEGYDYEDEDTKEEKHVVGLKEKLQKSFEEIKNKFADFRENFENFKESTTNEYNEFIEVRKNEYQALNEEVRELLPDALTGGLSHVYAEKRKEEEAVREKYQESFKSSILVLTMITLIPFTFSNYLIWLSGKSLNEVLVMLPNIILVVLPLYIPCFWWAFSANMKEKLSKRLVEEYTHKESLTKTFQGFAREIDNIDDESVHHDLRIRLLYNLLEVSAENPGKLILNYNRSDNPIFEALDKSRGLANSIEKIGKIPGINILFAKVQRNREEQKQLFEKDVKTGIDNLSDTNEAEE